MRWLQIILSLGFFGLMSFFYSQQLGQVRYHPDEISWFFHTKYFEELFLKGNIKGDIWQSYESYDHPPLVKYVFGGYLYLKNRNVFNKRDELEAKWGRWNFYFDGELGEIEKSEFAPYVQRMREISLVFTVLSLFVLYLILLSTAGDWWIALLMIGLLSFNNLFYESMLRSTSDSMYVLLMLGAVFMILRYVKKGGLSWLILAGVAGGLSTSAKLTGISVMLGLTLALVIFDIRQGKIFFKKIYEIGIFWLAALSIWILINPALYTDPLGNSVAYGVFRLRQSYVLADYFKEIALTNYRDRLIAAGCTMFGKCMKFPISGRLWPLIGVDLTLFLAGIYFGLRRITSRVYMNIEKLILFGVVFVWLYLTIVGLPFYSERYFLPVILAMTIVEYLVIQKIWRIMVYATVTQKNSAR